MLLSMKVFREIVRSGRFVAAATRLEMSAAMVSKHITHVERHLGARLLNRSSRSLSVTEVGRIFFKHCDTILEAVGQAESAVCSYGAEPRGTLRITGPSWIATRRMAEFLSAHRIRCPNVVVDMHLEDRLADIVEEGYDLALRSTVDTPPDGLIARPLQPVSLVIAASKEYLERHGTPRSPAELPQHDAIMIGSGHFWHFDGPGETRQAPARVVLRFRSVMGAAHAVSAGMGLAALPLPVLEHDQFQGVIGPILEDYPLRRPTLFAVYDGGKLIPPKVRSFIDHLSEYLAEISVSKVPAARRSSGTRVRPAASNHRNKESGALQGQMQRIPIAGAHNVATVSSLG